MILPLHISTPPFYLAPFYVPSKQQNLVLFREISLDPTPSSNYCPTSLLFLVKLPKYTIHIHYLLPLPSEKVYFSFKPSTKIALSKFPNVLLITESEVKGTFKLIYSI